MLTDPGGEHEGVAPAEHGHVGADVLPDAVAVDVDGEVGERIARLDARRDRPQVGVTAQTVYNWEKGRSRPQAKQLEKCRAVRGMKKKEA